MHSVKNRFLMRIKNITPSLYRRNWLSITTRDLVVFGACLLHEHSSLKAFWYLATNFRRFLAKRDAIMKRMRVDEEYMASWFSYEPVAKPAPKFMSRLQAVKSQAAAASAGSAPAPATTKARAARRA
jgi:hypothetical protein